MNKISKWSLLKESITNSANDFETGREERRTLLNVLSEMEELEQKKQPKYTDEDQAKIAKSLSVLDHLITSLFSNCSEPPLIEELAVQFRKTYSALSETLSPS